MTDGHFGILSVSEEMESFLGGNPHPNCPECKSETYVCGGEEGYNNVWCINEDCEWFTEIACAHEAGEHILGKQG